MKASALGASARREEYGRSETRQGGTHPAPGGPTAAGASRGAWCLADGSVDKLVHDVEVRPDPGRLKRPRAALDAAPAQGRPRESTGDAGGVQGGPKPARMRHKGDQLPEGSHADAATAAAAGTTEGRDCEPPGSGPAAERPEVRAGPPSATFSDDRRSDIAVFLSSSARISQHYSHRWIFHHHRRWHMAPSDNSYNPTTKFQNTGVHRYGQWE